MPSRLTGPGSAGTGLSSSSHDAWSRRTPPTGTPSGRSTSCRTGASVGGVRATRYDVMADEEVADDASQILSQQPASGS
jgi:hypothetical protein